MKNSDPGHRSVFRSVFGLFMWVSSLVVFWLNFEGKVEMWETMVFASGVGAWVAFYANELVCVLHWRKKENH